jgi:2-oxoglutarate dehydrogenase E2 component (dihydrolipoamide succinyltransferase)
MRPIIIPTINNNDTEVRLVEWLQIDGSMIKPGDPLAIVETSKSTEELRAETGGYLNILAAAGNSHPYGATIGRLFRDTAEREQFLQTTTEPFMVGLLPANRAAFSVNGDDPDAIQKDPHQGQVLPDSVQPMDLLITQAASDLIRQHGITVEQLRQLNKRIIKADDLASLIRKSAPIQVQRIVPSTHQMAIARVVTHSHATVPQSFVVKKVYCDRAIQFLSQYGQTEKIKVDLPDLLVYALSRQSATFPFFFGSLREDLEFTPSAAGNIGVTFDLGTGLFIPVIKEAAKLELKQIARKMMSCRMQAMRRSFTAKDLAGGDITLSLNLDADTVMVQPIIQTPQTCMVSVGSVLTEVVLDNEGRPSRRRYLMLGVAFDHRVINGYEASQFLKAIKVMVEDAI